MSFLLPLLFGDGYGLAKHKANMHHWSKPHVRRLRDPEASGFYYPGAQGSGPWESLKNSLSSVGSKLGGVVSSAAVEAAKQAAGPLSSLIKAAVGNDSKAGIVADFSGKLIPKVIEALQTKGPVEAVEIIVSHLPILASNLGASQTVVHNLALGKDIMHLLLAPNTTQGNLTRNGVAEGYGIAPITDMVDFIMKNALNKAAPSGSGMMSSLPGFDGERFVPTTACGVMTSRYSRLRDPEGTGWLDVLAKVAEPALQFIPNLVTSIGQAVHGRGFNTYPSHFSQQFHGGREIPDEQFMQRKGAKKRKY